MEYDEALINLVASYPCLYDYAHEKYKDVIMKRNLWKQIAQQLNMTEEQCRKRWIYLRDRYVRMRRVLEKGIPSGSESDLIPKMKWDLYPLLDALLHYCKEHRTRGNSFQLGSWSSQPDSESSSNEADTISPDNSDVSDIYISNDDDTPQVAAAGPAPATNTPKRKRAATDSVTPGKKAKLEGVNWQASLAQWFTAHQSKRTPMCPAVAAAEYIKARLLRVEDEVQQSDLIKKMFDIIHDSI